MSNITLPLPERTREIARNLDRVENGYLYLNKFLPGWKKLLNENPEPPKKEDKVKALNELSDIIRNSSELAEQICIKNNFLAESMSSNDFFVYEETLLTASRLILGLGNSSVLETSITLHPVHGIPYIPSTSIKGIVRNWVNRYAEEKRDDVLFENLFGSLFKDPSKNEENKRGQIIFFDSFPKSEIETEIDIMAPHYGPYYTNPENTIPGDWHSPNIINFLVVKPKTKFQFIFVLHKKYVSETEFQKITGWFEDALTEHGIGSKTSSGYGYFVKSDDDLVPLELSKPDAVQKEEDRPEWAIQAEESKKIEREAENEKSDFDRVTEKIKSGNPSANYYDAYTLWKTLEDGEKKLQLAQLFFEAEKKFMKGKRKKPWAQELSGYIQKNN